MEIKNFEYLKKYILPFLPKFQLWRMKYIQPFSVPVFSAYLTFFVLKTILSSGLASYNSKLISELKIIPIEPNKLATSEGTPPNFEKNIIGRNVFNIAGKIPFEDMDIDDETYLRVQFPRVPCSTTEKAPVDLLGIIYSEDPKVSLVTLKDPQITTADVYHEGDKILDHQEYSVYKITTPIQVQLRKKRTKICMSLSVMTTAIATESISAGSPTEENYQLQLDFIKNQLGDGFSQILTSARLVPEVIDDKMQGFKIFSIAPGTLFEKIKIENGDVIQSVNGINLQDPEQGFKIYETFQDENSISLTILRNGAVITKKVTVQ